ncbi:MAG: flagellin [Vampirovibrionales bacterium]
MSIQFVNTNLNAMRALNNLRTNSNNLEKAGGEMASGLRVSKSSDDVSGYAISQRLTNELRAKQRATQNVQDGQSMLDIAEGAMGTLVDNLQRVRELSVQIASDVYGPDQRSAIGQEMRSLIEDMARISRTTTFNGVSLLDGSITDAKVQLAGGSDEASNTINLAPTFTTTDPELGLKLFSATIPDPNGLWRPQSLNDIFNATTGTAINSSERALAFLKYVDTGLTELNKKMATLGALSNQLGRYNDFLGINLVNLNASRSRIVDADMSRSSANYTQSNVLQQASVSILAQANQSQTNVLQLLRR